MPYRNPAVRKEHNKKFGTEWSKRNRERKNKAYAKYAAKPENRTKLRAVARNAYLLRKYGISAERYDTMAKEQGFRCLICDGKKVLVVDHCHDKGHVRGLLCNYCNRMLGLYEAWKNKGRFDKYLEDDRVKTYRRPKI